MAENHEFQVSSKELDVLKQLASRSESLVRLLDVPAPQLHEKVVISLSRAEAERVRAYLTTQLASVGFDSNYDLNESGHTLESLIDRFYLP
jgi:hypothetical protein